VLKTVRQKREMSAEQEYQQALKLIAEVRSNKTKNLDLSLSMNEVFYELKSLPPEMGEQDTQAVLQYLRDYLT
jgi:hypothetical protein